MKRKSKGAGAIVTLTFPTEKIVEAFDNPDMVPMLATLHALFGEHIASLSRQRTKKEKQAKKGKRRKKTG